jgi:hypothetical protein
MMKKFKIIAILGIGFLLAGCASSEHEVTLEFNQPQEYIPAENLSVLDVSFTDSAWDGLTIPEGQQCSAFNGNGSSPELLINNIPEGTNAIIVSFSDRTYKPNDLGGHGIIGKWLLNQETSITIPSIPGESYEMPEAMFIVSEFRSNRGTGGAYLPPCSGGSGNEYYATISAVYVGQSDDEESLLLGEAQIELGVY